MGHHDLLHLSAFQRHIHLWATHYPKFCDGPVSDNTVQRSSGLLSRFGSFIERVCLNEVEAERTSHCHLVYPANHRLFYPAAFST